MGEADRHWFEEIADHLGEAYLRYSFTMGTVAEVDFLMGHLGLRAGMTVLDIGCGPGRHCLEFARRGVRAVGVDISEEFISVARRRAEENGLGGSTEFIRADARAFRRNDLADAAISLCQGAFGLGGPVGDADPQNLEPDLAVLATMRESVRPGACIAVSAFSSYFQVRWLEESDVFDPASAVNHEITELRNSAGETVPGELWTTCYTPRELRLMAERARLVVEQIVSVSPGNYSLREPSIESHEFLLLARRPDDTQRGLSGLPRRD